MEFILPVSFSHLGLPLIAEIKANNGERYGTPNRTKKKTHPKFSKLSSPFLKIWNVKLIRFVMSIATTIE